MPANHFTWWLFSWVEPLPGAWLYVAFAVLGIAAALLALGVARRLVAAITCLGLTYWILMEKAAYLNHRYLAALVAFLFVIVPADAAWSLRSRARGDRSDGAAPTPRTVPAWSVWLIRFQFAVPYFFGGVGKLNFDWLVRAEPLRSTLELNTDIPLVGPHLVSSAHVLAWASTALDLGVAFALLHRRTRNLAFAAALAFHFINSRLFDIGIFPWLMVVGTTVFYDADWPRRMLVSLRSSRRVRVAVAVGAIVGFLIGGFLPRTFAPLPAIVGAFGVAVLAFHVVEQRPVDLIAHRVAPPMSRTLAAGLAIWVGVQLLLPLRHFAIPGNVHWTEDGGRFAWHMLLRSKPGRVAYKVTDRATGEAWIEDLSRHLTRYQIAKARLPDLVLETAHLIRDHYADQGRDVAVQADVRVILNGRPPQRLVRSAVDLAEIDRPYLPPEDWVIPLRPYPR